MLEQRRSNLEHCKNMRNNFHNVNKLTLFVKYIRIINWDALHFNMVESITIFCSSSDAIDEKYFKVAEKMGKLIIKEKINLVYGGSAVGLMGRLAKTVLEHGGHVIGVIPKKISQRVPHLEHYHELIVTDTMRERKAIMESRADAFVALPGGFGTLEELIEIITLKQLQYHHKPVVILNSFGCFNHLLDHFEFLFQNSFAKSQYRALYHVAETPEAVFDYLNQYFPTEFESKWYLTKDGFESS
ncbi:MAG: TIGR00730 family Rossman fold protein [Promethearchaeota archaeon]